MVCKPSGTIGAWEEVCLITNSVARYFIEMMKYTRQSIQEGLMLMNNMDMSSEGLRLNFGHFSFGRKKMILLEILIL